MCCSACSDAVAVAGNSAANTSARVCRPFNAEGSGGALGLDAEGNSTGLGSGAGVTCEVVVGFRRSRGLCACTDTQALWWHASVHDWWAATLKALQTYHAGAWHPALFVQTISGLSSRLCSSNQRVKTRQRQMSTAGRQVEHLPCRQRGRAGNTVPVKDTGRCCSLRRGLGMRWTALRRAWAMMATSGGKNRGVAKRMLGTELVPVQCLDNRFASCMTSSMMFEGIY